MPFYEYKCPDCGHQFEELQSFNDPPIKVCPTCGKGNVKKLLSRSSFVLKGGGWYKDHYGLKSSESKGGESKRSESTGSSDNSSGSAGSKSANNSSTSEK